MEKVINSFIDNRIRFSLQDMPIKTFVKFRRANLKTTHIVWITLSPKWDKLLKEFYNPKAAILLFKN